VLERNLAASGARGTRTKDEARAGMLMFISSYPHRRYHKQIPY
jgi:hypothetical protein